MKISFFVRGEASSKIYTTEVITEIFKEEGGKLFDARSASLGHTLQGGVPSPIDRARAVRLSLKCMKFLEEHHQTLQEQIPRRQASPESAAVITIQAGSLKWVPVREVYLQADMVNRRPKVAWWSNVKQLVEALVAKPQVLGDHTSELSASGVKVNI